MPKSPEPKPKKSDPSSTSNVQPTPASAATVSRRKKKKVDLSSIAVLFLPVAFLLGIGGGYLLWGRGIGAAAPDARAAGAAVDIASDDPSIGPADAPVTIVEFSDYQCPFCRMWYEEVFSQLMTEYSGKIRFVYRDFPLTSIHPGAQPAAEAADCAGEQDKYWEFHNAIFSDQYDFSRDGFLSIASDIGLNVSDFTACIDSGRFADEVAQDQQDGFNLGVSSTPTFFINGTQVVGAQPYSSFKSIIDSILAGD